MRVSTAKQAEEGDSIPAQREALRRYITEHNMELVGEYIDDGISGTKYDRQELQRLLQAVEDNQIDIVLCTKMDRLHRSLRNFLNMQDIFDRHNVNWIAIWEPMYDTTTPQGRMIVNTMMNLAQFEAEQTGQRIRQVFHYKTQIGEVISGSTPPGYSISDKRLVQNEDAPNVLTAFKTYSQLGNLAETIRRCSGLSGLPVHTADFKNMLRNEKYCGRFRGNESYCEPIVPQDLFDKVQRGLSMNIKQSQKRDYIFSGLLVCTDCGRNMGGYHRMRHPQRGDWEELLYRCPNAFSPARLCDNRKGLSENTLQRFLLQKIDDKMDTVYTASVSGKKPDYSSRIRAIQRKIDRLKELYINDLIDMDEYRKDKEALSAELDDLRQKQSQKAPEAVLTADLRSLYNSFNSKEKRLFWRNIVREVRFDSKRNLTVSFLDE